MNLFINIFIFNLCFGINAAQGNQTLHHELDRKSEATMKKPISIDATQAPTLTPEQNNYLKNVYQAMLRVVSGTTSLEQEEKLFGDGKDHWPKTGNPTSRYYENPPDRHIFVSFNKSHFDGPWVEGGLSLEPSGFPKKNYLMNLKPDFFEGLILEKIGIEERPTEPIKRVAVFHYRTHGLKFELHLQFESNIDFIDLKKDKFPSSFHFLLIKRL
jgi:hypothetical protein